MVGFSGHGGDQLVELVVSGSKDGPVDVGSNSVHHALAVRVQQP